MKYILASASPRRRELLSLVLPDFDICVPMGEETCPDYVSAFQVPKFLSLQKATEVAKDNNGAVIIAADTAVFLEENMLGKPKDKIDAKKMLASLAGRVHKVITGCTIIYGEKVDSFSVGTEVEFYPLTDSQIDAYIAENESMDKAGAYGIQGKGALLVAGIKGDYFNVVGLPVAELSRHIEKILAD